MSEAVTSVLLWLFIINLGIAFGAGLYEHRIALGNWLTPDSASGLHWNPEVARHDDTGRRFWAFVSTVPLTLLTLTCLGAAWTSNGPWQAAWLGASLAALVERVFTFSYFIPTMIRLMRLPDSPEAVAMAVKWGRLNLLRNGLVLFAWLLAMQAFALVSQSQG